MKKLATIVVKTFDDEVFRTFFTEDVRKKLEDISDVTYLEYDHSKEAKAVLKEKLRDADVVFTGWGMHALDDELLCEAKRLKFIAHTGGSVADLVNDELEKRNIFLLSGNRYYAESVAEATICYMLMGQRLLYKIMKETEFHGWAKDYPTNGLRYKTIGLIGFGMIAKYVAKMLQPFETKVKVYAEYDIPQKDILEYRIQVCSKEEIFSTCDIVSIHAGLTPANFHLVNEEMLARMKKDALLVNTARGALVDEEALAKALAAGRIRAVLDVFEVEPLPMDSGLRNENAILVPHRGGPTTDIRRYVTLGLIEDIEKYYNEGREPENLISVAYAKNMTSHIIMEKNQELKEKSL